MKIPSRHLRTLLIAALFTVVGAHSARANAIYTYTGPAFTQFFGNYGCPLVCGVTGFFTLPQALPANFALAPVTPSTYSFTDGVNVFDPTTVQRVFSFLISTNAQGLPLFWDIALQTNSSAGVPPARALGTSFGVLHRDISNQTGILGVQTGSSAACFNCSPGTWSVRTVNAVPEPSSLLLLGTGLLGLGAMAGRRKPKSPPNAGAAAG